MENSELNIPKLRAERDRCIVAAWLEEKPAVEAGERTKGVVLAVIAAAYELSVQQVANIINKAEPQHTER